MKNAELAKIFSEIADLLEIQDANRFRVNSYRNAARAMEDLSEPVEDVAGRGELNDIQGVGKSTAEKIREYLDSGKITRHEELKKQVPAKLTELLEVPGMGPKIAARLWHEADIKSLAQLRKALEKSPEKISSLEGLGEKKVTQIKESLGFMAASGRRVRLGEADMVVAELKSVVEDIKGVAKVEAAGSYRRGKETVGDLDLLCQARESDGERIIGQFTGADNVKRVIAGGRTKGSVVVSTELRGLRHPKKTDIQADLRVVPAASFGAALAYFTGSKAHNVRLREIAVRAGMKLNEYGLFKGRKRVAGRNEKEIYDALGLKFVPPELREDRGEVKAAGEDKLPDLIEHDDIRGDLHVHTDASDGNNTIEEMARAAKDRGYDYLGICDHSQSQTQANGLDPQRLAGHAEAIRKASENLKGITLLAGVEVDIFKDGSLDLEDDVLAELDFVTASCHSALSMGRDEATGRIIRAIENPHVDCIGHPSGRLINSRPGMELDIEKIAAAAAKNDTALEVNAHYLRLDLRDTHVRVAVDTGAKLAINTDSHSTGEMDLVRYGVITARRGWATAADVINTYTTKKLKNWLKEK